LFALQRTDARARAIAIDMPPELPQNSAIWTDDSKFEIWVEKWIRRGGDVNARDGGTNSSTLLIHAATRGIVGAVEKLLDAGAAADLKAGSGQFTALMHAVRRGHHTVVARLLKSGASCTLQDSKGRTALNQHRGPDAVALGGDTYYTCVPMTDDVWRCVALLREHVGMPPLESHERHHHTGAAAAEAAEAAAMATAQTTAAAQTTAGVDESTLLPTYAGCEYGVSKLPLTTYVGRVLRVYGLTSERGQELNGKVGRCEGCDDTRLHLRLEGHPTPFKVKPSNVMADAAE